MKLTEKHARFVAERIARELANSEHVKVNRGLDPIAEIAEQFIVEDIKRERALDAEVEDILEDQDEDIQFYQADRRQLFWMIKRKIAKEEGFNIDKDDRFSDLAHRMLDELYEEDYIHYEVSDNIVKNLITKAIFDYGKRQDEVEDKVHEKIKHYKRKVERGTEEYDILYERLYQEEMAKLGL